MQKSTGTVDKVAAQEFHDCLKAQLWRESRLGDRPTYIWEEAVLRFLAETQHKRDHEGDKKRLKWLHPHLEGRLLDSIDRDLIDKIMLAKQHRAPGTINRYLATIRTILRKAANDWDWIDKAPSIRMRVEPKKRVRWIPRKEADKLIETLPKHLKAAAEFSLQTGLRQGNVLNLQWSQIDLKKRHAWVHADQAKGKRDLSVPLNQGAYKALQSCLGKHPKYVFTYRGNPLKGIDSRTWARACKKADIDDFRWHDLRHTWASWHVQSGTPLHTLMELGGWSTYEMVLRYAHLASGQLSNAAANIDQTSVELDSDEVVPVTNQLRCKVVQLPVKRRCNS